MQTAIWALTQWSTDVASDYMACKCHKLACCDPEDAIINDTASLKVRTIAESYYLLWFCDASRWCCACAVNVLHMTQWYCFVQSCDASTESVVHVLFIILDLKLQYYTVCV
jgi:hypothetical protein